MTLSDYIKEYRNKHGLSQRQFALLCGVSNGYISMLENQLNPKTNEPINPTPQQLKKIAAGMGLTLQELLSKVDNLFIDLSSSFSLPISPLPAMKEWNVIGATACGDPIHRESFDETVFAPADIHADAVFRCVGDSMIGARIYDGDLVFVRFDTYVDNGGIYLVRVDDSYTLKRVYQEPDILRLISENPKEPTRLITGPDLEQVQIVGKAVYFLSPVK